MQSLIKVCPTECSLSGLVTATSFAVNLDPLIWKISKTEMELHNGWCILPGTKQIESLCSALSSPCCITATGSPASISLTLNKWVLHQFEKNMFLWTKKKHSLEKNSGQIFLVSVKSLSLPSAHWSRVCIKMHFSVFVILKD